MSNDEPLLVWITIDEDTQIAIEQSGEVSDLKIGQKVTVELSGPMLESYPAQAAGSSVRIQN